jgi:hypothetical protein
MENLIMDYSAELVIRTRAYRNAKADLSFANCTGNKAWRSAAFRAMNVARSELVRVVRDTERLLSR